MTIKLNPKPAVVILGLAFLVASGVVYATVINRGVPGSFVIGQVQTAEDTILLYEQIQPSSADLTEVNFGTLDIDAFGNIVAPPTVLFWATNGGVTPFQLTVEAIDVEVNGAPVSGDILTLLMGPAGGELLPSPDQVIYVSPDGLAALDDEITLTPVPFPTPTVVPTSTTVPPTEPAPPPPTPTPTPPRISVEPGSQPVALELGLELSRPPQQLGLNTGDNLTFTVLFNAEADGGPGSFGSSTVLLLENPSNGVVAEDFNGDGTLHLAVAFNVGVFPSNTPRFAVFLGTGDGRFSSPTVFTPRVGCYTAGGIESADMNKDGFSDLLVTYFGANDTCSNPRVTVHVGDGEGGFATSGIDITGGTTLSGPEVGDFDKDGNLDVVVTDRGHLTFKAFFGLGDGTFGNSSVGTQGASHQFTGGLVATDFNDDGFWDVASATYYQDSLKVNFGFGRGGFIELSGSLQFDVPSAIAVATEDFDEDGLGDLVVASNSGGTVTVFSGAQEFSFSDSATFEVTPPTQSFWDGIQSLDAGDFGGDGHMDIVVEYGKPGHLLILLGDGEGGFDPPFEILRDRSLVIRRVLLVDLNGDGWDDVVTGSGDPAGTPVFLTGAAVSFP